MKNIFVINGSPNKEKGDTGTILNAFLKGFNDSDHQVSLFYSHDLDIKPCTGEMHCWYKHPGKCYIRDDMDEILHLMHQSDTFIIATPIYIPIPSKLQIFLNRIVPLIIPELVTKNGRTRARFRENVNIERILLITTGGWWEKENADVVLHIAREIAENSNVEFSGVIRRPHAFLMKSKGKITEQGKSILEDLTELGKFFSKNDQLDNDLVEKIARPLISQSDLQKRYNSFLQTN